MEKNLSCGFHCIKLNNIGVKIGQDEILKDINIHIHCGELTVIIGENGAGKSTLLKAILGEVKHTGNIEFFDIQENKYKNLKMGYVPQQINVEKHMPTTVYDFIAATISNKPIWLGKDKKVEERIKDHLKIFNAEDLINKSIGDLSGGELQRVLLAASTIDEINLLILDEPVSGIDRNGIKDFFNLINNLKKEYDMSIILVSHDLDLVKKYADKVILLDKTILTQGTPQEVFESKEFKEIFEVE